jgi:hypothetical protein
MVSEATLTRQRIAICYYTRSRDEYFGDVPGRRYGSTLAGDRFLFTEVATPGPPPPFTVVLNWQAGLKK